ncbi:hypothetical protein [Sphingorhabdus sp. YGSMI21]|uniref:hypothetical protein n=1 Tax=Sphingorhabdus sp. YGSMI21 TaxID=2077182 RepID=UPI000C1F41AD|nr:hypothetical protein [Sphingorhabdus sp. YGSMI21]ATW05102.1 hypothetical protein CHN51_17385 [Sphingorhabdus sp. YGSMI21]
MIAEILKRSFLRATGATVLAILGVFLFQYFAGNPMASDNLEIFLPIIFISTFLASLPNDKIGS